MITFNFLLSKIFLSLYTKFWIIIRLSNVLYVEHLKFVLLNLNRWIEFPLCRAKTTMCHAQSYCFTSIWPSSIVYCFTHGCNCFTNLNVIQWNRRSTVNLAVKQSNWLDECDQMWVTFANASLLLHHNHTLTQRWNEKKKMCIVLAYEMNVRRKAH